MIFETGAHIGPYTVERSIGAGGMGRVFRAYDPRLERRVALKVLSTQGSDNDARQRLLAEARSASALNHPHICTVYKSESTTAVRSSRWSSSTAPTCTCAC